MTGLEDDLLTVLGDRLPPDHPERFAATRAELVARWAEPHRRYHGAAHLEEVLAVLAGLGADGGLSRRDQAVADLAAWFHDAVYDPTAEDNERQSARLAASELGSLGVPEPEIDEIVAAVTMTADHVTRPGDPVAAALHDADLWILSAPTERFDEYCVQVRQEYAAVPDNTYRIRRSAILHGLLSRERLYLTERAQQWTSAARANLLRELDHLADGPGG